MPAQSIHAFAEKVALITDGASAVGRAVALQLALQGCYTIVGFSEPTSLKKSFAELQSLGTLAHTVEYDPTSADDAKNLVAEAEKLYGRLDLLAHTVKHEPPADQAVTDDVWQTTLDANAKSFFFIAQTAFSLMKPRPKPAIAAVLYDCEKSEKNPAFAAAQSAVRGTIRHLSQTLPKNFRVNGVEIGVYAEKKDASELFITTEGVAPDDAARAVVYLLSSEAKSINGQIIKLN